MYGWNWMLYHRDSRQAMIATGVADDQVKARELVELAARVADEMAGVGVVISPRGKHDILHRTPEGSVVWRPMFPELVIETAPGG